MAQQTWTSKLGNTYPKEQIDSLDKQHHEALKQLRREPANRVCAECEERDTTWASVTLGVFLCVRCADVHRALGSHISKVKGCSGTYLWGPDEINRMRVMGNAMGSMHFGDAKPPKNASKEERVLACMKKYGDSADGATAQDPSSSPAPPMTDRRIQQGEGRSVGDDTADPYRAWRLSEEASWSAWQNPVPNPWQNQTGSSPELRPASGLEFGNSSGGAFPYPPGDRYPRVEQRNPVSEQDNEYAFFRHEGSRRSTSRLATARDALSNWTRAGSRALAIF